MTKKLGRKINLKTQFKFGEILKEETLKRVKVIILVLLKIKINQYIVNNNIDINQKFKYIPSKKMLMEMIQDDIWNNAKFKYDKIEQNMYDKFSIIIKYLIDVIFEENKTMHVE